MLLDSFVFRLSLVYFRKYLTVIAYNLSLQILWKSLSSWDILILQRDGTYMFNLDGLIPKICLLAQEMGEEGLVLHLRSAGLQALSSMVIHQHASIIMSLHWMILVFHINIFCDIVIMHNIVLIGRFHMHPIGLEYMIFHSCIMGDVLVVVLSTALESTWDTLNFALFTFSISKVYEFCSIYFCHIYV